MRILEYRRRVVNAARFSYTTGKLTRVRGLAYHEREFTDSIMNPTKKQMNYDSRVDILGVHVNAQRFDAAIDTLAHWAAEPDGRRYVCILAVSNLMPGHEDPLVRSAINGADMVTADGMPIVWVQRWWGHPQAERVYGPDIMLALCGKTARQGIRHFYNPQFVWGVLRQGWQRSRRA